MVVNDLPELEALLQRVEFVLTRILTAQNNRALEPEAKAGEYAAQSFYEEELVALIHAFLRQTNSIKTPLLKWGGLQLNPKDCEVVYFATPVSLTPKEYELLELFLCNSRQVYSCSNILEHLWAGKDAPSEEAVRTHIKGLRRKLKAAGAPADFVETVYGFGYRLKPLSPQDSQMSSQDLQSVSLV
jgi:DNA-binding response OmpR family regulator